MTQEEFNVVFELQMRKCADILAHKKKEYTGDNIDRLSAFKIAAALQNCDPKAALAGMMSKHVVSLYDMCYSTLLHFDMEQWDEKITDCINYLILLKALVKEEQNACDDQKPYCGKNAIRYTGRQSWDAVAALTFFDNLSDQLEIFTLF